MRQNINSDSVISVSLVLLEIILLVRFNHKYLGNEDVGTTITAHRSESVSRKLMSYENDCIDF